MTDFLTGVPTCIEHEKLTFERKGARVAIPAWCRLSRRERAEWDRRRQAAPANLVDHGLEHGCSR